MTDIADQASEHESQWLARSLAAQQTKARQVQGVVVNRPNNMGVGARLCMDCEDVIPKARVKANPCSLRCVACQGVAERKEKRGA